MDAGTARILAEIALVVVTAVFGGGYLRERRRGRAAAGELGEAAAQSMISRAEAEAIALERERLARIESDTKQILKQQDDHSAEDKRRFQEHADRLADAEHRLHKHGSAIMAQGAALDTTRSVLGLATTPGEEPGERWRRMLEEPRRRGG